MYSPINSPKKDAKVKAKAAEGVTIVVKGDIVGHEFHGNQWTGGAGGGETDGFGKLLHPVVAPINQSPADPKNFTRVSPVVPHTPTEIDEWLDTRPDFPDAEATHQITLREQLAADAKMTLAEYDQKCQEHIEGLMKDAVVWSRCGRGALEGILQDGRFKSQHETETSGGLLNPAGRKNFEDHFLGTEEDMPAEQRPIFGYLCDKDDTDGFAFNSRYGDGSDYRYGGAEPYGRIAVRFNDAVRQRTTMTEGDSLRNDWPGSTTRPDIAQKASPVNRPDLRSFRYEMLGPLDKTRISSYGPYMEAQIYGQVKLADVAEIVFQRKGDYDLYHAALEKAGIPHRTSKNAR